MDQATLLRGIYLFKDASEADLASMAGIAAPQSYLQGQMVFNEGEEADAMFVVELGTVDIVPAGKDLAVATVGANQAFGELAFFSRGKRPASARAREKSSLCRIPFDRLERLLAERPTLALGFNRNACAFLARLVRGLVGDLNRRYF